MSHWPEQQQRDWDEARIVRAFVGWLRAEGWTSVETEVEFVDVVAERGEEKLFAEVKGKTSGGPGKGVDTLYGQLLRRMPPEEVDDPKTRFAVVVPMAGSAAALRVPKRVRNLLRIEIYAVSHEGTVEKLSK